MPSTFPTTLDSFATNKADGTAMVVDHAAHHNNLADAINKIELYARLYATKTVAPANFPFPELADYQCDGTADQVQIQAAIDNLPANDGDVYTSGLTTGGGRVVLLPGVYHLSAGISVDCDLAELVGFGRENTRLVADSGFSGAYLLRFERNPGTGNARPTKACALRRVLLDGGARGTGVDGVYWRCFGGTIEEVNVYNTSGWAIHAKGYASEGLADWGTYASSINRCDLSSCASGGIWHDTKGEDMWVVDCHIHEMSTTSAPGIKFNAAGIRVINTMVWYCYPGMYCDGASRIHIRDCKFEQNLGGFYTSSNGGSDIQLINNSFASNGHTGTGDDIQFAGSTYFATIIGNNFSNAYSGDQARYGINFTGTYSKIKCAHNNFDDFGALGGGGPYLSGYIQWSGTDTQLWLTANRGYPTEARGSGASIAAGTSSTTVTHGLPYIPSVVQLTPTSDTQGRRWWISAKGSTTFTISLDANATTNPITFDWRAFYTANG